MLGWFRRRVEDLFGAPRSPRWRSFREEYLQRHPTCAACGAAEGVDLHHIRPVWKYPELELVEENCLPLCGHPRNCHWSVGHGFNWRDYRPGVRELAAKMLESPVVRHK